MKNTAIKDREVFNGSMEESVKSHRGFEVYKNAQTPIAGR